MFDYLLVPDLSGVRTPEPGPIDKVQAMTDLRSRHRRMCCKRFFPEPGR